MTKIFRVAECVVYYYDEDGETRFLLIKKQNKSGQVARVAPKGKLQNGESNELNAIKGVSSEIGVPSNTLDIIQNLGVEKKEGLEDKNGKYDKEIIHFLMKYLGSPDRIDIKYGDCYLGVYKWATISEISNLIYHSSTRELFRKAYNSLQEKKKKNDVKQNFMDLL